MNNTIQRLLLFFVGIPGFVALVIFVPFALSLPVVLIALFVIGACTAEMTEMLASGGHSLSRRRLVAVNVFICAAVYLACLLQSRGMPGPQPAETILYSAALGALILFAPAAFTAQASMRTVIGTSAANALVLLYPGIMGAFWILITSGTGYGVASILSFALMTFGNDSIAWFTGVTMGRKRGVVAASPNKSVAGFIGGLGGSIMAAFLASVLFPDAIRAPWYILLVWGLFVGVSVIVGDLFESALKRSAGIKDSGNYVPGRGGFLDSFDSLLFAAPGFVIFSKLFGFFS